jgi:hypothetical protein
LNTLGRSVDPCMRLGLTHYGRAELPWRVYVGASLICNLVTLTVRVILLAGWQFAWFTRVKIMGQQVMGGKEAYPNEYHTTMAHPACSQQVQSSYCLGGQNRRVARSGVSLRRNFCECMCDLQTTPKAWCAYRHAIPWRGLLSVGSLRDQQTPLKVRMEGIERCGRGW